jgi:hypothetical protein
MLHLPDDHQYFPEVSSAERPGTEDIMTRADHVNMIMQFASDIAAQAESMEYLNADLSSIVEELSRVHEHMTDLLATGIA